MNKLASALADLGSVTGKFLTITFVTLDGRTRTINGRTGVRKYLKNADAVRRAPSGCIVMYDVQNGCYRSVRKDAITAVRMNGVEIAVVNLD